MPDPQLQPPPGLDLTASSDDDACISSTKGQQGPTMRSLTDSSTFGLLGCFFVFLLLMILAGWIALQIMESMSPGECRGRGHDYSSNHSSTLEIKSTSSAGKSMATPAKTSIKPIARPDRMSFAVLS